MSVFDVAFAHPCAYTRMDALVFMCMAFPGSGFVSICLLVWLSLFARLLLPDVCWNENVGEKFGGSVLIS